MKYGRIAGNKSINALIYHCFRYLHDADQDKFARKFKAQHSGAEHKMHLFRELILGAHLSSSGLRVRYEHAAAGRTPDWCILDETSTPTCIIELLNFHIDHGTKRNVERQLQTGHVVVYWRDEKKDNVSCLYDRIRQKADRYRSMVRALGTPYVIAVFGDFLVSIDPEEVHSCLEAKGSGLFDEYTEISGVLYFQEAHGRYVFSYMPNARAPRAIDMPDGVFPIVPV